MANYPNYNGYNPMANPQGSYNNFQNPYGNYQNANMGMGGQNNYVLPQQQQLQNTFAYVNGVEGAKGYLLAPNTQAVLFDSDGSYFYIKTANAQGQATLRTYKYSEITENSLNKAFTGSQTIDTSNYITRQEFEQFKAQIVSKPKQEKITKLDEVK